MRHVAPSAPLARRRRDTLLGCLCALLMLSQLHSAALAQTAATGAVAGRVTDRGGAVIVGAEVELRSAATGQTQRQRTNRAGQFSFSRVAPGAYEVAARMQGFRRVVVAGVRVEVAKAYDVEVTLDVGDLVETVTVEAGTGVELQKRDATVGSVVTEESLVRLPSLERNAIEFLTLQPGVIPEAGDGDNGTSGGAVAGARSDQNTFTVDGIDITENSTGGGSAFRTMIPAPVESVEEFRVGVTNLNASFGRASGAQVALVGRRGTKEFHGAGYWYHQNDALNANTWTNNRTGVAVAPQKDHRYGLRLGGPLFGGERTFFFANYERRDFSRSLEVSRVVPTDTLRQGVVRFRDNAGRVVSYDLATSTLCSPTSNRRCDPRGLGLSPAVSALWSLLPAGNDPSVGDGLNTTGWRSTASAPLESDYFVARFDHQLSQNWQLDASATYYRRLSVLGGATSLRQQLDIRDGGAVFPGQIPQRGQNLTLGVTGLVTPAFTSSFKFGWSRDRQSSQPLSPSAVADLLAIPGTQAAAGRVALNIGGGQLDQLLSEPIDVDGQRARAQANDNEPFQFVYDGTWLGRGHTFQFGANVRHVITRHARSDRSGGALTSPVADIFRGSNIQIPNTSRPPTCAAAGQLNCLQSAEVQQWDTFFSAVTGMIDAVNLLAVRGADLASLPTGTALSAETTHNTYDFYFQDHWQPVPSLVVNLGLAYGWQAAPVEKFGRQTLMINNETGEPLTFRNYIEPRRRAALAGDIYNPQIAFLPIDASGRDAVFDTDRNNLAPRFSVAWNPSFETGALGLLFGPRRTVVRGGFAVVYDRVNTSESVIIPTLGVGFGQAVSRRAPTCNSTGAGGAGCTPGGTAPASVFRVGVDGLIPLPIVPSVSTPIVPTQPFGETSAFQIDPEFKVGKSYSFDLTLQRELPGSTIFEVGWIGRLGRELPANVNFNSSPIFHRDPASGQTFAQAFDVVAQLLRAGAPAASVPAQSWFQNNVPGGTTRVLTGNEANFISGNVSNVFQTIDTVRLGAGLRPFNNLQTQTALFRTSTGRSNYHALAAAVRKRLARELAFDLNYTFAKSLDTSSALQQVMAVASSAFFPDFDYGPSDFDRTHVFNAHFVWELPVGRGRFVETGGGALERLAGGWSLSGILRAASGLPVVVTQGTGALGGGAQQATPVAAIPLSDPDGLGAGVNHGVAGASGVGANGDPSTGGSGINLFAAPAQALSNFRRVLISQDGRSGRANPLRGFGGWNLDLSLGKTARLGERVSARVSFDFFNVFNHTVFATPSLDLSNPRAFGVVTQQTVPTRREAASRWIQLGARVEF